MFCLHRGDAWQWLGRVRNVCLEYKCIDQSGLGLRISVGGRPIETDHIPRQMVALELETNEMFIPWVVEGGERFIPVATGAI